MPGFGIIILAAGGSQRLGQPKQMASYRGKTLLRHAVEVALASVFHPAVIVLGAQAGRMRPELEGLSVVVRENAQWEQGMASSLHAGLQALPADADGTAVMLCDQPLLTADVLNELANSLGRAAAPLAACEYGGTLGVPALFTRALHSELLALSGAEGAKKVILRHAHKTARVPFPGGVLDIDTPEDLARLASRDPPPTSGAAS